MKRITAYGLTCVLMMLASAAAQATTIVLPTDEQLIAKSPVIVEGTVVSTAVVDLDGRLYTDTTVSVERTHKGSTPATITVREIGGATEERITRVYGTPEFAEGERVLLFLEQSPRGGYRTMDLYLGKFREERTAAGRRLWYRDTADNVELLDDSFQPLTARNIQRDADAFETFVGDRVAGRSGLRTYGIENPVLAPDAANDGGRRIESNFTLIAEPNVYRWFRFASGQSAQWYSSGSQTGYSGGGVNELQTAMAVWNDYGEARINYTYAGNRTGSMGGLDNPNQVNEVLFNDPLNEIAGSFNKNTGGVVGIGGFNGVGSKQSWTASFAADGEHKAGTQSAWNITEGNLSIQDGVTPGNGISSNRLAEIVAHEFGHTLGFGHSLAGNALMFATVTGLGPSLRADDQVAARWLYPNGSGGPAPTKPAAPTSLFATGGTNKITLGWTDNATDETSQAVYTSTGGGAYVEQTVVNPNVVSTTLNDLAPGTYNVYVVARNAAGASNPSNTVSVAVTGFVTPVPSFTVQFLGGMNYRFTDTSTGTVTSTAWNFGDGQNATGKTVEHTYVNSGQFTVTMTLNGGSYKTTKSVNVNGALAASFLFAPAEPKINDPVLFTDQSTGAPTSWSWSFGDGTSSTLQNPAKSYAAAGNYTVTLTVRRGTETASGARVVSVRDSSPVTPAVSAAFDVSTLTPAAGVNVKFTDRSTGSPIAWQWSFGDGSISAAQNPIHAYAAAGTYTVTLIASNASTSSTITRQIVVSPILSFRTLVSVAAQTSGVGGTSWRTELNVFNAGAQGANVTFVYIPTAGGSAQTRTLFLSPKQSTTYANALLDLFAMPSGAGALAIEASSAGASADLRVTSRTFTGSSIGTYGQSVPDVRPESLPKTFYITGIAASDDFRTNVGLVNRSENDVMTSLVLYNNSGSIVASKSITLAANSFQQSPLNGYFPEITGSIYDALTLRVIAANEDAVSAYCSVVDNDTQDPIYIQAIPAPAGNALTIPVVGRAPGANGTFWRSDVTLFNPTTSSLSVTLRYGNATKPFTLGGLDTMVLRDILAEFSQTSGSGTLGISWSGATGPVVTSRTYTTASTGGTYGQSIDPVASFDSSMFVPGLRNDAEYRSNVGFVNGGGETEVVTVRLLSAAGTILGEKTLTLAPNAQLQYAATALFPGISAPGFTLQVEGDANAQVFAYGSMVDNKSGDPVFFAGR